ncbi:MAG TPA: HAD-IA family hydrolase [Vicinamibacterales bacterium]|jgi:putative hydrolase of the HAD superfamily
MANLGVFFDLVGTLIHGRTTIGEQYAFWARRFGAEEADPDRLEAAFRRAMLAAPRMAFPGRSRRDAEALERAWWKQLVRAVIGDAGLSPALAGTTFDLFFENLFSHFTTEQAWQTYQDAIPALTRLHARGLIVGVITNYDARVYAVLDTLGLSPLLDSVTIPADVGASKPDAAIFAHALVRHGLDASDALFVGDELEDDYRGAVEAGMQALLLDRDGRWTGMQGIDSIPDLREL